MRTLTRAKATRRADHQAPRRGLSLVLVSLLAAGLATAAGGTGHGSKPASNPQIQVEALTQPSIVMIITTWRGYVQIPANAENVRPGWIGPVTAQTLCSGFVASSTGYLVTAGHCVDNQSMTSGGKAALIEQMLAKAVARGVVTQAQSQALNGEIDVNGAVRGLISGSAPSQQVEVFQPNQTVSQSASNGLTADVVDFKSMDNGDVGLLKVQSPTPLPVLLVAPQTPPLGSDVTAAGYPGSVTQVTDTSVEPSFKTGSISSTHTVGGVPFNEISAPVSQGMSGGPTFDAQGRVDGTVDFGPLGESQPFNFITDTATVRSLLSRNGVSNTLTPTDRAYRDGLADYWAGHYHAAAAELGTVVKEDPTNASASQYQAKAIENFPNEVTAPPSGGFPWGWLLLGVALLLVVVAGGASVLVIKRRGTQAGTGAAGWRPGGGGPAAPSGVAPASPGQSTQSMGPLPPPGAAATAGANDAAPAGAALSGTSADSAPASGGLANGAAPNGAPPALAREAAANGAPAGRFCPRCGTPHSAETAYCESCGYHLVAAGSGPG